MASERETGPAIPKNRVESIIALLVALGLSLLPLSEGMTKCLNMRVMDKTFDASLGEILAKLSFPTASLLSATACRHWSTF
jgi:hypothetical protein